MEKRKTNFCVKDVLELQGFDQMEVLAGSKGLDRKVTNVSVMDAPDIYKWMKGGEILMTTAFILKDDPEYLKELIIRLDDSGASALAIKLKRFVNKIPCDALKIANERNFPIITLPENFAFTDVIKPVLSQIVNKQAEQLLISEKIHKSFTRLVLKGGGCEEIVKTLSGLIKEDVAYWDNFFEKTFVSKNSPEFEREVQQSTLEKLKNKYDYDSFPVENWFKGYLFYSSKNKNHNHNTFHRVAREHAISVLKLDFQKRFSNYQVENRYRDEFLKDILFNNFWSLEEIENRAKNYHWKFSKPIITIVVDIDNFKTQYSNIIPNKKIRWDILECCRKYFREYFPFTIYTTFSDYFVFLIEYENYSAGFIEKIQEVCNIIRKEVKRICNFTITMGISNLKNSVVEVPQGYEEAKKTVHLGRTSYGNDKVYFFQDLEIYQLLYEIYNTPIAEDFCNKFLGELEKYDNKNNGDLIETLEYLVYCDWNMKKASQELHIHYNTMKYRYEKIFNLMGIDPNDVNKKTGIVLALKLKKMRS